MERDKDLIPRFWFCLLFTFPFFVRKIDPTIGWLLATIVLVVGNWSFFLRGWKYKLSKEMLFSVSVGVLYIYSLFEGLLSANPILLYSQVASVTMIILLEQLFEQHADDQATQALQSLIQKTPTIARKLFSDGHTEEVAVDVLKDGDSIRVAQGELFAVDGVVYSGDADVDESLITGDAKLVHKELGSAVYAATINHKGTCLVRAIRSGKQSLFFQMLELITKTIAQPASQMQFAEKISSGAIVAAVMCSCVGFFFWSLFSGLANAVLVVSAICIAACPCALLLSSLLVKKLSIVGLAKQGIVVKSFEAFVEVAKCTMLVVNKNGTLTVGKPSIASLDPADGVLADELLKVAASLEATSVHAYAKCILERAGSLNESLFKVDELQEVSGLGIKGVIDDEVCVIGDERLVQGLELGYHKTRAEDMRKQGYIVLFCAKGQKLLGILVLSDPIRRGVKESVKEFKIQGFGLFCLSGDRRITVVQLVNALGFDRFQAEAPAEQKIFTVKKLQNEGKQVLMIGDPVKDAAALCQANAGVALGTKGNLLQEQAPITLLAANLTSALDLVAYAKKTNGIMTQNQFISIAVTVIAVLLALFGALTPVEGGVYMLISTVILGYNSLRLS